MSPVSVTRRYAFCGAGNLHGSLKMRCMRIARISTVLVASLLASSLGSGRPDHPILKTSDEDVGFQINAGLNDAWFNPVTNGQGFVITVFPEIRQMFLAWFTYDIERPPEHIEAILGDRGHRWLTAQGPFEGDTATLEIVVSRGGIFDAGVPEPVRTIEGSMEVVFDSCTQGLVRYEMPALGATGEVPIVRIVDDNVPLCEALLDEINLAGLEVEITGPEEIVFDWSSDRCETEDIPDLPARAFRDADGNVQLIASNRRMIGSDLDSLVRDCSLTMGSDVDPNPAHHNDWELLHALYTTDGQNIHALVHNEYTGHTHPGMCPSGSYFQCWYNSVTYASSTDQGKTYTHLPAPAHLVASVPYRYVPDSGPYGIFNPSNIIHNPADGYYYSMLHLEPSGEQQWGTGVMRTRTIDDPSSWRCWDGSGFNAAFVNPYTESNYDPGEHICAPVSRDHLGKMYDSLTFNTYLNRFLLIGATGLWDPERQEEVNGFYFSLSDDLINWTPPRLIMEGSLWWTANNVVDRVAYPSVLDPDDTSRNFENSDSEVYLYFTRWNAGTIYDRDLIRIPIRFRK